MGDNHIDWLNSRLMHNSIFVGRVQGICDTSLTLSEMKARIGDAVTELNDRLNADYHAEMARLDAIRVRLQAGTASEVTQ